MMRDVDRVNPLSISTKPWPSPEVDLYRTTPSNLKVRFSLTKTRKSRKMGHSLFNQDGNGTYPTVISAVAVTSV